MKRMLHGMLAFVAVFLVRASCLGTGRSRHAERGRSRHRGRRRAGRHRHGDQRRNQYQVAPGHDATGSYQVVNLVPAAIRSKSSSRVQKSSQVIALEVGRRAARRGAGGRIVSEVVTVAESPRLLNANDATLGAIPQMQVANLPLRSELGRPAGPRARPGRSLHRAGRRHVVRAHGRHQRPALARSKQLPARRRRQQQHLGERPGSRPRCPAVG